MTKIDRIVACMCLFTAFNGPLIANCKKESWSNWALSSACSLVGRECCVSPFVKLTSGIPALRRRLHEEFFGQHLALETALTSLDAHLRDSSPGKALVLSFHGWAGSGKTYLVELIASALYQKGVNSKYVKMYMASLDFGDETKVAEYKKRVQKEITATVKLCEHAMFVFDEVDKTPPKLFDAVIPFISHPQQFTGSNHKKSIFIFIGNTGASGITTVTLGAWKEGRLRESLTFRDYESKLATEAFNKEGTNVNRQTHIMYYYLGALEENGLYHSGLIDKMLVDYFIPFLPLERSHVMQCAVLEGKRHKSEVDPQSAKEVADSLTYWPPDLMLYSQSGCRKVEGAVKYMLTQRRLFNAEQKKERGETSEDDENEEMISNEEL